jgi:Transcription factor WhiB
MSPSPAPVRLACQRDPDRWFDRHHRSHALAKCLACPARRWCAQQALQHRASWGMWAGIWIDGRLDDVAPYLRRIAAGPAPAVPIISAPPPPPPAACVGLPALDDTGVRPATPLPPVAGDPPSVRAAVTARSFCYCEVMAPGCRLTSGGIIARVPDLAVAHADASLLFCVCTVCGARLSDLDQLVARRLGYRLPSPRAAIAAAFYWRHARWVLLDETGGLRHTAVA